MTPLDLTEWAQSLAVGSGPNADFAREVLDLIENNMIENSRADDWDELVRDLEFAVGHRKLGSNLAVEEFTQDQALRALEGLRDKAETLVEVADILDQNGFPGPVDVAVDAALDKLEAVSDIVDWVRTPEDHAEAIADLRKLFALPEPKKPKLEFDL